MCRNIKPLFNFDPPATDDEIKDAATQFVRKLSGFQKPSQTNEQVFNQAIERISADAKVLLNELTTDAPHKNREVEAQKAKARSKLRFG